MAGIWAIGEVIEGRPTRLTLELATLAQQLASASGSVAATLLVGPDAAGAVAAVATYGPHVMVLESVAKGLPAAAATAALLLPLLAERAPDWLLIGATPDGKDLAGALVGLTDLPILVNASAVRWADGPVVAMSTYGGRLLTHSAVSGSRGIILVRPGSVLETPADVPGTFEMLAAAVEQPMSTVRVTAHVATTAASASIEEARIIVAGGRGVGGPEGFAVIDALADAMGGAVGATRAVVDAGWLPYEQQIGQTGKIVKPDLYVACGISGAIQHKVGVQTAGTIVAINRDADAPIAEFADLLVVADLFEVLPLLTAAILARKTADA